jgi:biotin synthase
MYHFSASTSSNNQAESQFLPVIRHDWTRAEILDLLQMPFMDLLYMAASIHRKNFSANNVQISTLLSIKTGGCPEDCSYCPQSAHYKTGLEKSALLDREEVKKSALKAKEAGATRFCMGAAWRQLHDRDLPAVCGLIEEIKNLGMESCMTLGMLSAAQAEALKNAGLDYYNHNLDTSPEYYEKIITTRCYQDRLDTLAHVRAAGMNVCCGGIIGLGETLSDRAGLLEELACLPKHPESVPINMLVRVEGTALGNEAEIDPLDFVRVIAVARILMPNSYVRLSAGREQMSDELQAWCFFAGANSIFYGEKLLTTDNPATEKDQKLFSRLGLSASL